MRAFLYVLVIVSFFSCSETTIVKQGNTLNLEVTMYTSKKFDLSEMYDSLECVILETNEQSLLADRAYLLYADEENMFVKSDNKVYRFDKQGHFLNSIGQIGNAPGEYNIAYSISVNRYNNSLVYYIGQNTIQLWSYEGQFLKEIKLSHQGEITAVRMLGTDRLVAECRIYHDEGLLTKLCQFDLKGNLLKSTEVSNDNISVSRSMHTMPLLYNYRQSVKYKETHGSGLYEIKEDMYRLQWKIDLGKYAPTREVVEDMNRSEALMRDYAQLVDMQESTDCFFPSSTR